MDIVGKRGWYFLFSAVIILAGIVSLAIPPAFNLGIDFTSGSAFEVNFSDDVDEETVRMAIAEVGFADAGVQMLGVDTVFFRTRELNEGDLGLIEDSLTKNVGSVQQISKVDTVSPIVAQETVRNAIIAVLAAAVGILIFITWAFRHIPGSFRYGVSAVMALSHDMLIVIGIFSILGKIIDVEVNAMFVIGLLAVAGYSVNDSIVIFDRIRDNVSRDIDRPLSESVNISVMESIGRSLGTSLTTFFALMALILLGGSTLRDFLLVLMIGLIVGTYSSIFIASQFLVMWEHGEIGKAFRFLRLRPLRNRDN